MRVVRVRADAAAQDVVHGEPVHLVPGACRIARPAALADGDIETAAVRQVEMRAAAEALEQELVEQPGAHQPRVEGRKAAEVVVVEVEGDEFHRFEADGQKTARHVPCRRRWAAGWWGATGRPAGCDRR